MPLLYLFKKLPLYFQAKFSILVDFLLNKKLISQGTRARLGVCERCPDSLFENRTENMV